MAEKPKRKPISKKLRFEIFKRDGFTCQYCGANPPAVVLEPDHINPVCNGGTNDPENLITSCFDCNRGKAGNLLTSVPQSLKEQAAAIKEREEQIAGFRNVMEGRLNRIEQDMWDVAEALVPDSSFDGMRRDWLRSIKRFNEQLPIHEVLDAAEIARSIGIRSEKSLFLYFCKVCWNKIRG